MDTNKMRKQFEAKFQTPIGMVWCDATQQYVKALGCICPATAIAGHNQLWKCWQASREAVVIDLSRAMIPGGGYFEDQDTIAAIETHGLKVTP